MLKINEFGLLVIQYVFKTVILLGTKFKTILEALLYMWSLVTHYTVVIIPSKNSNSFTVIKVC